MEQAISIYENAKHWIAQYESVDEVKQYADKAAAVQEYARRSNDYDIERLAARARVRAERRCGEMLLVMEKSKGGRPCDNSPNSADSSEYAQALSSAELSSQQSSKYQQLANVPESEFEEALTEPAAMPSAHGILNARKEEPAKRINEKSLYLWGRLIAIEKNLINEDIDELLGGMTPAMRKDSDRILPLLITWLTR